MTLPEQVAKAVPVKVQKALENLMQAVEEVQAEFAAASDREKPLPQSTIECKWISSDGKAIYIGDMHDHHVRNALAKIVNMLNLGMVAYMGRDGRVMVADRMVHVVDDKEVFIDEDNNINTYYKEP